MYDLKEYHADLDTMGLKNTWNSILSQFNSIQDTYGVFNIGTFGRWYEEGCAYLDKKSKKNSGVYYTPGDVADLMSYYFDILQGDNICDICCGTGNLIMSYLKYVGEDKAYELLQNNKIWLYDIDPTAMNICRKSIELTYNRAISDDRCVIGDFLNNNIHLPSDCKVISNPPYFSIKDIPFIWKNTYVLLTTKEIYAVIMEKILTESKASIVITPWSFISTNKFYSLRQIMNNYNGFILCFDNMPSCIFNGKKQGQFNTNANNAVRAAITVTENIESIKGYRVSGLIRFKAEERQQMLKSSYLETAIGRNYQLVDDMNQKYAKCIPSLEELKNVWFKKSNKTLKNYIDSNGVELCIPNTCRYYTVATIQDLKRDGKIYLKVNNYKYIYCLLNSSFAYWYWRMYDGGIQITLDLLYNLPCFYDLLSEDNKKQIEEVYDSMTTQESKYLVYKKNAGKMQENVKFPKQYRDTINKIFLTTLCCSADFTSIHSNSIYSTEYTENEQ